MPRLRGRNALITGSNGGIGYAIAAALADQGCNIMLNGPGSPEEMEQLRSDVASRGVKCIHSPADVGKPAQIERMINEVTVQFGSLDILVNNAVIRHFHPIEEFPVEEWDAALAVNLSAAFHTIRLALPGMKKRNWGRIINMGSIHSLRARENRVDYVTAKHAIIGLTRTVALEVAQSAITCNALQPGWVLTPHSERQIADQMARTGSTREEAIGALLASRQPSRRFVTKEQLASFVVFLCSEAASNITGSALSIDGGWSAAA